MKLKSIIFAAAFCLANTVNAESFQLEISGGEPLYQTSLPKAIYQYSRSNALQDLTITNASGELLPYALLPYETLHAQTITKKYSKPLPVFPIKESSLNRASELNIQIEKNTANTAVSINGHDTGLNERTVYLLDLGKKHPPLQTLSVDWQNGIGELLSVDVLASDDLKTWSAIGHGVLLKTTANGNALLQNMIKLDSTTEARYLQVRPSDNATIALTKATADYDSVHSLSLETLWQELRPLQREQDDTKGVINLDFESLGHYPANYLRVHLPQTNTISSASILIRNKVDAPWQYLTTVSLYRMDQAGKSYTNPDILLNASAARYWRLQFDQTNGGIGKDNPTISLGWLPQTVVWNARGQAPFSLHIGNNPNMINTVNIASLIPNYKVEKVLVLPKAKVTLSMNTASKIESSWTSPPDYKNWILWAGLFLGVLLLAGMVFSLLKSKRVE